LDDLLAGVSSAGHLLDEVGGVECIVRLVFGRDVDHLEAAFLISENLEVEECMSDLLVLVDNGFVDRVRVAIVEILQAQDLIL
jgi:hypothetical protein